LENGVGGDPTSSSRKVVRMTDKEKVLSIYPDAFIWQSQFHRLTIRTLNAYLEGPLLASVWPEIEESYLWEEAWETIESILLARFSE
jgi:hypothetical protein